MYACMYHHCVCQLILCPTTIHIRMYDFSYSSLSSLYRPTETEREREKETERMRREEKFAIPRWVTAKAFVMREERRSLRDGFELRLSREGSPNQNRLRPTYARMSRDSREGCPKGF